MKKIGITCSNCQAPHEVIVKNFSGGMARTLVRLCRRYELAAGWIDAKQMSLSPGDLDKLSLWGLVNQAPAQGRKKKSGLWAPTTNGWNFAKGLTTVVSAVTTENGVPVGYINDLINIGHTIKTEELQRIWSS